MTDSLAHSINHRSIEVIDSMFHNIDFRFDSLKINIERPSQFAETPEIISLTATKGRIIDRRRAFRDSVDAFNQLDSVAYHLSADNTSTQHSATTSVYNPPDGSAIAVVVLIIAGILLFNLHKKF
ncbi:MAG: hypothetical protein HDR49_00220 [Bacteroides sp.]|nr:hypothetical protein [Bacteroides sp.]